MSFRPRATLKAFELAMRPCPTRGPAAPVSIDLPANIKTSGRCLRIQGGISYKAEEQADPTLRSSQLEFVMNLIIWLVVGGLIGWVASMIMKTDAQQFLPPEEDPPAIRPGSLILNVVVGIVGSISVCEGCWPP